MNSDRRNTAFAVMTRQLTWYGSLKTKRQKEKLIVPWQPRPPCCIRNQAPNHICGVQMISVDQMGIRDALGQKCYPSTHSVAHFGYLTKTVDFRSSSYWLWDPRNVPWFLRTSMSPVIRYNDWPPSRHSQTSSLKLSPTAELLWMLNSHFPSFPCSQGPTRYTGKSTGGGGGL